MQMVTLRTQSPNTATEFQTMVTGGMHATGTLPHLPADTVINGRYRCVSVLGEGGMGVVYHAQDTLRGNRDIAIKTLTATEISADRMNLFKAEFGALAMFRHPNVAVVYDFEQMQGSDNCLFTMELIN